MKIVEPEVNYPVIFTEEELLTLDKAIDIIKELRSTMIDRKLKYITDESSVLDVVDITRMLPWLETIADSEYLCQ